MKIVAYIANYDKDVNARNISKALPCENYIIDSSGMDKQGFIHTDYPFGAGCQLKSMQHFLHKTDGTHFLFICSDIVGNWKAIVDKCYTLPDSVGVYTPSVWGQGWPHNKPVGKGLRSIPFAEVMACIRRDIIEKVHPIDPIHNKHAYGYDLFIGYTANTMGYQVLADDDITVYHPYGTGYSSKEGDRQMLPFALSKGDGFMDFCKDFGLFQPFYIRWLRKYASIDLSKRFGYYR